MPPRPTKKRPAPDEDEDEDNVSTATATPMPTQTQRSRPRNDSDSDEEADEGYHNGAGSLPQLSKSLVRYALACEFSRTSIKRADINQKVIGLHKTAKFKDVFDAANSQLMDTFGMMLVELPNKEKVTIREKRAQALSESQNPKIDKWVLQSTLPDQFRTSDIMGPSQIPTAEEEAAYNGLYSMTVALILLSGGRLSESKLDRFLKRMNADDTTPVGSKEMVLARMVKDGYIVKIKDSSSGEDIIDYMVGPRGKVEIGAEGTANMVRKVYGESATGDIEQRLARSLQILDRGDQRAVNGEAVTPMPIQTQTQSAGRPRQQRRRAAEDSEDE